ncbi:ABC transporter ATP-binding protein [Leptodesmis sp.]|uniref:ABC transporter ATP-binding protein n=1 Tax=Leptodesmis sp. TaxID=3100501 RepID=UPI0040534ADD
MDHLDGFPPCSNADRGYVHQQFPVIGSDHPYRCRSSFISREKTCYIMTVSASIPQLQLKQVSLAPNLFRSAKVSPKDLASVHPYYFLLQDVSLQVFTGDRIAIIGPSGSGKTSLLRLINRLNEPTSGTLYFEEQPYSKIPVLQLRQQVVLVLQESKLLGMMVQDALAYPLQLRGLDKKAIQARMGEWIERLHIPSDWLNRTEQQLSVGQRQIVAIARAALTHPKVLLLDEPTSALDAGRSQQLLGALNDLSANHGTTILMINHQLDLVEQFSDRLLYLEQGRLLQDQTSHLVDWLALKQQLQNAERQQAEEWM